MTHFLLVVLGALGLYAGGEFLVRNASRLARATGMSPLVVGLTVVAFGTSSPELATTLTAAVEGSPEAALGNVVGSNVFNVLFVLGTTVLVRPLSVSPGAFTVDLLVMLGLSLLALPLFLTGRRLGRREGAVLLGVYLAYVGFLYG